MYQLITFKSYESECFLGNSDKTKNEFLDIIGSLLVDVGIQLHLHSRASNREHRFGC
jgi:hypothetical protein